MDTFQSRVASTLDTYYTWSIIKDVLEEKLPLAGMTAEMTMKERLQHVASHTCVDGLRGLIYFYDHYVYRQLWSKPPSKACLKAAIVEVCDQ